MKTDKKVFHCTKIYFCSIIVNIRSIYYLLLVKLWSEFNVWLYNWGKTEEVRTLQDYNISFPSLWGTIFEKWLSSISRPQISRSALNCVVRMLHWAWTSYRHRHPTTTSRIDWLIEVIISWSIWCFKISKFSLRIQAWKLAVNTNLRFRDWFFSVRRLPMAIGLATGYSLSMNCIDMNWDFENTFTFLGRSSCSFTRSRRHRDMVPAVFRDIYMYVRTIDYLLLGSRMSICN